MVLVLIHGCFSQIGRHMATHLVENGLAEHIRLVDRGTHQTAVPPLSPRHKKALESCEFMQIAVQNSSTSPAINHRLRGEGL